MTEPSAARGRPRPQETIARDEKVLELIAAEGELSRAAIAEKLGITPNLAYMSIFRLKRAGLIERTSVEGEGGARQNVWRKVAA
jgi:predicted transcriptional regulator